MKTLILGLLTAATLGAAVLPASAAVIVAERPNGAVVVRDVHRHHLHRVVVFDRFHHRRVIWR
jgi:hypothetical protein